MEQTRIRIGWSRTSQIMDFDEKWASTSTIISLVRLEGRACIDESLVPFKEELLFRQLHRYGMKLFKLSSEGGHTCEIRVYAGKDCTRTGTFANCRHSLNGRILEGRKEGRMHQGSDFLMDNSCAGIPLAQTLTRRSTNIAAAWRQNRKGLSLDVFRRELEKDQTIAR